MTTVTIKSTAGTDAGSVDLDATTFGAQLNVPLLHQVVTAQLAKRRAGTQSTKTRAEVRGGGRKPHKQKGTGGARQGSIRAPHYSGGGVALGPKPRSYDQKTPKKMIKAALRSALSDRANDGKIVVVDGWNWSTPKTKDAIAALSALGVDGKVLVVIKRDEVAAARSFRNIPWVQLIEVGELNAYDVLCNDYIVFTSETLPTTASSEAGVASASQPESVTGESAAGVASASEQPEAARGGSEPQRADDEPAANMDEPAVNTGESAAGVASASEQPEAARGGSEPQRADDEPAANMDEPAKYTGSHGPLADNSEPEGFPIKGNEDSMLYHVPGSRFYKQTIAEVWFATEDDAEAAGFAKPGSKKVGDEAGEPVHADDEPAGEGV
jgi:large subunit ribosomal protein L4